MSANSPIEWTDHTFNPWWGCLKVSPGCEHCYAETLSARYGHRVWGPAKTAQRRLFGAAHWAEPIKWNADAERGGTRRRVFCASMADVLDDHPAVQAERGRLWRLVEETPWLDWLLLTKRPENFRKLLPASWLTAARPNVWLGTSVEDQQRALQRVPLLLEVPAVVHFLSCEPLLASLDIEKWLRPRGAVDWVIVGGESGPAARRMAPEWAVAIREQCRRAGTRFFFKQAGSVLAAELGMPGKGGHDLLGLTRGLRVREFPELRCVLDEGQLHFTRKAQTVVAAQGVPPV